MKKIFCPDTAIIEKNGTIVAQLCTIYTDDDSVVTLITPKEYPAIGQAMTKNAYYIKDGELVKSASTGLVTNKTVMAKVSTVENVSLKIGTK